MAERYPLRVNSDNHYLIHKVAQVEVDDRGILRFQYDDGTGKRIAGPGYPSFINDEIPLGARELAKNGLQSPEEVNYLVAYHSGAFPNGLPVCLMRTLADIPAKYGRRA